MGIKINALYGNNNTWLTINGYGTLATLSQEYATKPYFRHTIGAGLLAGNLDKIDKSICPIAVDSGSTLANGHYVMLKSDKTLYNYTVQPTAQTALMFASTFRGDSNNTYYSNYIDTRSDYSNAPWDSGSTSSVYISNFPAVATSMSQPIVEFTYKNYVLLIIVYASATNEAPYYETSRIRCDLSTYIDRYASQYPYVNCVEVTPFRWATNQSYPAFIPSNVSVNSDTSYINSASDQTYFNFSAIPIGNVNNMTDSDGNKHLFYISNNTAWGSANVSYWDGDEIRNIEVNSRQVIFGYGESWTDDLYNNYYRAIYIPDVNNMITIKQRDTSRPDRVYTYYKVDDINAFKDFCLKQTAYFGMYFTTSVNDIINTTIDKVTDFNSTYMGIIDNIGVTHGDYAQGKNIKKYPQSDWDSLKNQSPYDYSKDVDPTTYDDITKLSNIKSAGNAFVNIYACNYTTVLNLKRFLYNDIAKDVTQDKLYQNFLTTNPIDCITGCIEYPFNVIPDRTPATNIVVGNVIASGGTQYPITGYELTNTLITIDFGTITYFPVFGDFRDYEPYSDAEIYIPYIGFIPVAPSEYMGQTIGVKMICDLMTGSAEALIYRNTLVTTIANGNIGTQVPITGIQQANYANTVHAASSRLAMANNNTLSAVANTVTSVATGNIGIGIMSGLNLSNSIVAQNQADYDLNHVIVPFKQMGTASPNINFANEQRARLILRRPVMDNAYNADIYANTIGFACCQQGLIRDFVGYSEFAAVILNTRATEKEKNLIIDQLERGVIL